MQGSNGSKSHDRMEIDSHPTQYSQSNDPHPTPDRPNFDSFDFHARRPSIAGTKRKMSSDRAPGDIDPQLIGPGMPSSNPLDPEGPAPKRRGSAVDTQRIAQLSLYERRNSVDSRPGANGPQWWGNERRDSTSSAFSNTPLTGYSTPSSGFPGDSPHGRPPSGIATFAWPANAHPDQAQNSASGSSSQPPSQSEPNMSGPPQYDPLAMMPPASYAPDRRMSAPAVSAENTPSTGPTRNHRSRSRPPSRVRGRDQTATSSTGDSPNLPPVAAEDASLASASQLNKEPGSTPYSRSPELRISHKLAERKRRKEMKELFDELRDQLPADRGMKASKWEILSKAIDFIVTLKQSHQEMSREIDMLRHDLDGFRQGMPAGFPPGGPPPLYGHGPPVGMPYPPPPPGAAGTAHPHTTQPPPPPPQPGSRPGSSQNSYPPPPAPIPNPAQNGTAPHGGSVRTETPS
ncbi:hypothetical protein C8Q75DRAFT_203963 [Abortiporus biennis]|nr:hypothetical protein C8Q75DRAFT_203963 [Abortiporus biennis]